MWVRNANRGDPESGFPSAPQSSRGHHKNILFSKYQHKEEEPGIGGERVWVLLRLPGSPGCLGLLREEELKKKPKGRQQKSYLRAQPGCSGAQHALQIPPAAEFVTQSSFHVNIRCGSQVPNRRLSQVKRSET